jgi:hypothetical protein
MVGGESMGFEWCDVFAFDVIIVSRNGRTFLAGSDNGVADGFCKVIRCILCAVSIIN